MAAAKIEAMWDYDMHDNSILVLEKKRGKLSLSEVGDFLRYEKSGSFQGNYVLIVRAGEATCGGSGWMKRSQKEISGCFTRWSRENPARCAHEWHQASSGVRAVESR